MSDDRPDSVSSLLVTGHSELNVIRALRNLNVFTVVSNYENSIRAGAQRLIQCIGCSVDALIDVIVIRFGSRVGIGVEAELVVGRVGIAFPLQFEVVSANFGCGLWIYQF